MQEKIVRYFKVDGNTMEMQTSVLLTVRPIHFDIRTKGYEKEFIHLGSNAKTLIESILKVGEVVSMAVMPYEVTLLKEEECTWKKTIAMLHDDALCVCE